MKVLKVYGVKSLMEWQCVIPYGKTKFHFAFTDGATTSQGVTPARFRTTNPIFQRVIESSSYFKAGKIILEKRVVLEADADAPAEVAEKESPAEVVEVNVSCLDDAKDYLSEKFGESRTKMRTSKAIIELGEAHNIKFVGI